MTTPETLKVTPLEQTDTYSLVEVRIHGINGATTNQGSDTFYECKEGSVVFAVNGTRHSLHKGDVVFVPRGVRYQDMSSLGATMLACCVPPFDPDKVKIG